ncbi:AHH domain-containing protein, partial [Symbiobacterium thermophilum]
GASSVSFYTAAGSKLSTSGGAGEWYFRPDVDGTYYARVSGTKGTTVTLTSLDGSRPDLAYGPVPSSGKSQSFFVPPFRSVSFRAQLSPSTFYGLNVPGAEAITIYAGEEELHTFSGAWALFTTPDTHTDYIIRAVAGAQSQQYHTVFYERGETRETAWEYRVHGPQTFTSSSKGYAGVRLGALLDGRDFLLTVTGATGVAVTNGSGGSVTGVQCTGSVERTCRFAPKKGESYYVKVSAPAGTSFHLVSAYDPLPPADVEHPITPEFPEITYLPENDSLPALPGDLTPGPVEMALADFERLPHSDQALLLAFVQYAAARGDRTLVAFHGSLGIGVAAAGAPESTAGEAAGITLQSTSDQLEIMWNLRTRLTDLGLPPAMVHSLLGAGAFMLNRIADDTLAADELVEVLDSALHLYYFDDFKYNVEAIEAAFLAAVEEAALASSGQGVAHQSVPSAFGPVQIAGWRDWGDKVKQAFQWLADRVTLKRIAEIMAVEGYATWGQDLYERVKAEFVGAATGMGDFAIGFIGVIGEYLFDMTGEPMFLVDAYYARSNPTQAFYDGANAGEALMGIALETVLIQAETGITIVNITGAEWDVEGFRDYLDGIPSAAFQAGRQVAGAINLGIGLYEIASGLATILGSVAGGASLVLATGGIATPGAVQVSWAGVTAGVAQVGLGVTTVLRSAESMGRLEQVVRSVPNESRNKLRQNMEAVGRTKPAGDYEAHHICPYSHSNQWAKKCREIFARFGVSINDPNNGAWMPKSIHRRIHTDENFKKIYYDLESATSAQDLRARLENIWKAIEAGKYF